jgi:hypothetical protein
MNDSLTRKFCESRYRWPIVATATLLVALAAVLPQADDYFNKRNSRNELSENLVRAQETADTLPQYEERVAEVTQKLEALEQRTVDEARLASFRNRIVDVVREAGCQIRQFEVAAPSHRPWLQGDDPLKETPPPAGSSGETPFALETRSMVLTVDGSMSAINDLLARLEKEKTLSHPHRIQVQATSASGESVTMELELWLFALSRGKA